MPEGQVRLIMCKKSRVYPKEPKTTGISSCSHCPPVSSLAVLPKKIIISLIYGRKTILCSYTGGKIFFYKLLKVAVWMTASVNMKSSFSVAFLCYFQKDKKTESYRKSTGNKTGGGRAALSDNLNLNILWFVLFMKAFYCRTGWGGGSGQYPKSSQDYLKLAGENGAFQ